MRTELYWIEGPWPGRLAIAPRPRGEDWLEEELSAWRRSGVDVVVSLLTSEEEAELGLLAEADSARARGLDFVAFPIPDREVPASREAFSRFATTLGDRLGRGEGVAVHCRQGIGRAALVTIGLLTVAGVELNEATRRVGSARGRAVPETPEQLHWLGGLRTGDRGGGRA